MKKRVKYCDALRIIAIISVIAIHVFASFRDYYLPINKMYYVIISYMDSITRMGVPIFFMITGAFMLSSKKEQSYNEYIKQRIPKLLIPFIIFSLIYYLYEGIKNNSYMSFLDFIMTFLTSSGVKYHLWFMYVIIIIYFFIPFLGTMVRNLNRKNLKILILLIFIFGNLLYTINLYSIKFEIPIFSGISLPDIIKYTNYLFVGYYLYNYKIDKKNKKVINILGILLLIILPFADLLYINNQRNDVMYTASSIFAFFASISLFIYFKENYDNFKISDKITKIIDKTIPIVFYIYMVHVIIIELIQKLMSKFFVPTRFITNLIFMIILLVLSIIGSYLAAEIFNLIYSFCSKKIKKLYNSAKILYNKHRKEV